MRKLTAIITAAASALSIAVMAPASQGTTLSFSAPNERTMVSLTNHDRAAHGLRGYRVSSDLTQIARSQAMRMAKTNTLYHNPRLRYVVTSYRWAGENVGYAPNAAALERAFMKSPEHRANILNRKYTQVGIGAVVVNGRLWVSEVFRQPR